MERTHVTWKKHNHNSKFYDLEKLFGQTTTRVRFSIICSIDQSWSNRFDERDFYPEQGAQIYQVIPAG